MLSIEPIKKLYLQAELISLLRVKYHADNEADKDPARVKTVVNPTPTHLFFSDICSYIYILTPSEPPVTKVHIAIRQISRLAQASHPICW